MRLLAFWNRVIPSPSPRAIFNDGVTMGFVLSLIWLVGTGLYLGVFRPEGLAHLTILFFGTTFCAIPACVLGGFSALAIGIFQRVLPPTDVARAVSDGVVFGLFLSLAMLFLLDDDPWHPGVPETLGTTLYMAFCGRISAKIYETTLANGYETS
ncbi:MAG: hypothetical protein SFU56_14355 [Capsulimonadales bacterium]|nr:hypothetical protein [Capsulimonadales bacterium]